MPLGEGTRIVSSWIFPCKPSERCGWMSDRGLTPTQTIRTAKIESGRRDGGLGMDTCGTSGTKSRTDDQSKSGRKRTTHATDGSDVDQSIECCDSSAPEAASLFVFIASDPNPRIIVILVPVPPQDYATEAHLELPCQSLVVATNA